MSSRALKLLSERRSALKEKEKERKKNGFTNRLRRSRGARACKACLPGASFEKVVEKKKKV